MASTHRQTDTGISNRNSKSKRKRNIVKDVRKVYESQNRRLTLKVESDLDELNLESIEPLWKLLEASSLEGSFRFCVNRKIQGAHDQRIVIKVVGLNQTFTLVVIKCQSTPEYCFEGTLSGRNGDDTVILASSLNQSLREITGNSWYDPDKPMNKKREIILTPKPLVSVDTAMTAAITPPEPIQPIPQKRKSLSGTSRDFETTGRLFRAMAARATSYRITSVVISDIIMTSSYGSGSDMNRKCCGPVMNAWVRHGWLKREGRKGNAAIYTITDAAIQSFHLDSPQGSVAVPVNTPVSSVSVMSAAQPISDNNLLGALRLIREKAERFNTTKASADELELKKMQLEDDLKKVQGELDALKLTLDDADLQKASAIWAGLQESVQKTA